MSKLFTQYRIKLGRIAREIQIDIDDESLSLEEFEALSDMWAHIKVWLKENNESED